MTRPVYLHGSVVSSTWRDATRSLTDLIFDCVSAALRAAALVEPVLAGAAPAAASISALPACV